MLYIFLASWKIIVVTADVFGDLSSNMQGKRKFSCCCVNLILLSRDCRDEEEGDPRVWPHFHEDDILSAAMYPTGLVATSSYDGLVKVLLTSGSDGSLRAWSVCGGGLLGYFTAAQGDHNSVLSMTANGDNSLLITGDTAGFIKVTNPS